jgi:HlyD family type I secretion membrane fusion protein
MKRLLGIDFGLKRCGLAITDDFNIISSGLMSIESKRLIDVLKQIVLDKNIGVIVLGLPKRLNNEDSHITQNVIILSEVLKEIKETDMEIVGLFNQLWASKDILKRSAITTPVAGKVMNIKYHTIGAVVPAGGEMMNIVPQNEELIIEAKIKPTDIDNIAVGMKTKIQLTDYAGKKVPKLNGKIINISADIMTIEQTKESYFIARVSINKKDIEKLKTKVTLYPGMPAQVFIVTGARSLVSYLFTPISDSTYKAFREE